MNDHTDRIQIRDRQRNWSRLLLVVAAVVPVVAVWIIQSASGLEPNTDVWSTSTICGVMVAQLTGVKCRQISRYIFGPAIGITAGVMDLHINLWLYETWDWSMTMASYVPVWGMIIGVMVASDRSNGRSRAWVFIAVATADLLSRMAWDASFRFEWMHPSGNWQWLLPAMAYVPTSMLAVHLTLPNSTDSTATR